MIDRRDRNFVIGAVAVLIIVVAAMAVAIDAHNDCERRGGILLRDAVGWYVCVNGSVSLERAEP